MERNMFTIQGRISLPLTFTVKADSEQAAINYANSLFNKNEIVKIEADLHSKGGKCHLIIADKCEFDEWKK